MKIARNGKLHEGRKIFTCSYVLRIIKARNCAWTENVVARLEGLDCIPSTAGFGLDRLI